MTIQEIESVKTGYDDFISFIEKRLRNVKEYFRDNLSKWNKTYKSKVSKIKKISKYKGYLQYLHESIEDEFDMCYYRMYNIPNYWGCVGSIKENVITIEYYGDGHYSPGIERNEVYIPVYWLEDNYKELIDGYVISFLDNMENEAAKWLEDKEKQQKEREEFAAKREEEEYKRLKEKFEK